MWLCFYLLRNSLKTLMKKQHRLKPLFLDEQFPNLHRDHVVLAVLPSFRLPKANTNLSTCFPLGLVAPLTAVTASCRPMSLAWRLQSMHALKCQQLCYYPGRISQKTYCGLPSSFRFRERCWVGSKGRCVTVFTSELEDVVGTQVGAERCPQCRITETHCT